MYICGIRTGSHFHSDIYEAKYRVWVRESEVYGHETSKQGWTQYGFKEVSGCVSPERLRNIRREENAIWLRGGKGVPLCRSVMSICDFEQSIMVMCMRMMLTVSLTSQGIGCNGWSPPVGRCCLQLHHKHHHYHRCHCRCCCPCY